MDSASGSDLSQQDVTQQPSLLRQGYGYSVWDKAELWRGESRSKINDDEPKESIDHIGQAIQQFVEVRPAVLARY
jgi:hypothetical protein